MPGLTDCGQHSQRWGLNRLSSLTQDYKQGHDALDLPERCFHLE